jgi:hypothetical protein
MFIFINHCLLLLTTEVGHATAILHLRTHGLGGVPVQKPGVLVSLLVTALRAQRPFNTLPALREENRH